MAFLLLGGPVGDLSALQHRPPVSLHVIEQRDDDAGAQQQLEIEELEKKTYSTVS